MDRRKATLIGMVAVVLWSAVVGLIRSVAVHFGPVGGAVALYTASSVILLLVIGFPKLRTFPRKCLVPGGVLFCCCELCFSLSLGFAHTSEQTLEVAMVNHLWPSMVILFAIVFNGQKANLLVVPGMALAFLGVFKVLGGEHGIDISVMGRPDRQSGRPYAAVPIFCGFPSCAPIRRAVTEWSRTSPLSLPGRTVRPGYTP